MVKLKKSAKTLPDLDLCMNLVYGSSKPSRKFEAKIHEPACDGFILYAHSSNSVNWAIYSKIL